MIDIAFGIEQRNEENKKQVRLFDPRTKLRRIYDGISDGNKLFSDTKL